MSHNLETLCCRHDILAICCVRYIIFLQGPRGDSGLPGIEGLPGDSSFSGPKGEQGEPGEKKHRSFVPLGNKIKCKAKMLISRD
jgi:hypothetical protein